VDVPGGPRVRGALADVLAESHIPVLEDDLALAVTELVVNVVRHSSEPVADQLMEATLWRADGHLWLAVSAAGDGDIPVRAWIPALNACHGRGLLLVDAVADVRVVLPRPGAASPSPACERPRETPSAHRSAHLPADIS
jgi:hypothetical protein